MSLCAVYVVWFDGIEILPFSIAQIEDLVDEVIIVYSNASNFGEEVNYVEQLEGLGTLINWEPAFNKPAHINEAAKRNFALTSAKAFGHSHFIMLDVDEIYDPAEFKHDMDIIMGSQNLNGLVCKTRVYVRKPTLTCEDHTLVPFIHKLTPELQFEIGNKLYPFAYDNVGQAHIDPTRRLNITDGVMMSGATMHHFSHVRKNIRLKLENSTARSNLTRSTLLEDYENAVPGYHSKFYRQDLVDVPNRFGITF